MNPTLPEKEGRGLERKSGVKVFITYASAGAGHFKSAEAIYNQFRKINPLLEVKLIDVLDFSNPLFKSSYIYGYGLTIRYFPKVWASLFYLTSASLLKPLINRICSIINRLNTSRFRKLMTQENPEFIISTHFLSSELISLLKRNHKINSRLITVITDFGVHPFWLQDNTDIYIVASEFTKQQLIYNGIREENIKVLGIPIDSKFQVKPKADCFFRKFNLDEHKFTVLIVTGSFGIGPIEEIVDLLHQDVQVLVVCARNKKLFARLNMKNYPNVRIFGFIDNIEELMGISDIIITKPGGLTISEVLAMELVPIFISIIPGQESENVNILRRYGIGIRLENVRNARDIVLDYKEHPDKLNRIKENIKKIKKPFVAEELYRVIC